MKEKISHNEKIEKKKVVIKKQFKKNFLPFFQKKPF